MRALLLAVLVLAVAGCGGDKPPMTDADVGRVERWSAAYRLVAADMLAVSDALTKNRFEDAGARLEGLPPKVRRAAAHAGAIETAELRATLGDYMRVTRRTIAAFDGLVTHMTTNRNDNRDRIRRTEELRSANDELFKADAKIHDRILDHATPEQRERLERAIPAPRIG